MLPRAASFSFGCLQIGRGHTSSYAKIRTLQVMVNVIDFGMNIQDAIDFPRIHHQWKPDQLDIERGISPDTIALLKKAGYPIEETKPVVVARVEAILLSEGSLQGGHDQRGPGKAAGY